MLKSIDLTDLKAVERQMGEFIWTFKHGDNIMYNFEILAALYDARKTAAKPGVLNKPITVTIVSILEAMVIDFLDRLHHATNHLPANLSFATIVQVKVEIQAARTRARASDGRLYFRRKMYKFSEIVDILERHELFGAKGSEIYGLLKLSGDMRNRVHIENYFGALETDEPQVFTPARLESLEKVLDLFWVKMTSDYKRPWNRQRA